MIPLRRLFQLPHIARGYARGPGESEYPELWRDLAGAWPIGMHGPANTVTELVKGKNGVLVNSPTWVAGPHGPALDFNGNNTTVETNFSNSEKLADLQYFTVTCRLRNDGGTSSSIMWSQKGATGGTGHGLMVVSTGFSFYNERMSEAGGGTINTYSWTPDAEYHVVSIVVTDRLTVPRLFLDSNELSTTTDSGSANPSQGDFVIGGRITRTAGWEGLLWDVQYHNRSLTDSEVSILHNIPYAPFVKRRRIYVVPAAPPASSFPPNSLALSGVGK